VSTLACTSSFYALLQAHDAAHLRADIQLGTPKQLLNILVGAKLQQAFGQSPYVALTFPVLVDTDAPNTCPNPEGWK
jgi:tyrosyl-tRNA synthetase